MNGEWYFLSNSKLVVSRCFSLYFGLLTLKDPRCLNIWGPFNTKEINRKSIATYYYTKERNESEIALDHNTLYKNTRGITGLKDRIKSGIKASVERLKK